MLRSGPFFNVVAQRLLEPAQTGIRVDDDQFDPRHSGEVLCLLVIYARICTKSYIFRRNKAIVEGCLLPVLVVLVVLIDFPLDFLRLITYS